MTLAEPRWLLLLLLLPLLATGAVVVARLRSARWQAFVAGRLRQRLIRRASPVPRWISFACLLLALALLIVALARPQSNRGTRTDSIMGRNILLVLDLSRSMQTPDIKPSRLAQAKTTCYELLEALPNDRIGLVGFAGSAYLFAPLTVDHHAVRETITEVEVDWIPTGGSNIVNGLELGIETLKETGTTQNAIILMSDGEEHVGRIAEVAEKANSAGVEVITIGFGTTEGDFVPDSSMADGRFRDRSGSEVISRLEPRPLERLATLTGGRFAIASSGADISAMVETAVADLDRVQMEGRERTVVIDYYQWFLLPAILLLIGSVVAATRWRGVASTPATAVTALIAFFLLLPEASAASYSDAKQALAEQRYADAAAAFGSLAEQHRDSEKGFRYHLAQGTAAYRSEDYPTARRAFSEALRSDSTEVRQAAHHGLGNTLFQIGWQRLSGGPSYPEIPEEEEEKEEDDQEAEAFDRLSDALLDMPEEADVAGLTLGRFEKMAKERLAEWMAEETEDDDESRGYQRFNSLLTDWIDGVRHFDGAEGYEDSRHNRELTVKHLKKLREIFDQLEQNAQQIQAIPQPVPGEDGEGEPQEGEGDGEPQDGEGESRENGEPNDSGEDPDDGSGDEGEEEGDGDEGDEQEGEGETEDGDETGAKPGETEEDAARRILRENADLQKGALSPGRIEYRRPEKDW